ncbi:hypothetical protein Tco_0195031 [Tanacetum coccineum]
MAYTNISQQQSDNSQQPSHKIREEEEDETEPVPTLTSKKPGSGGKRVKKMAKKRSTGTASRNRQGPVNLASPTLFQPHSESTLCTIRASTGATFNASDGKYCL